VPDHHGLTEKAVEIRPGIRERRRLSDHGIVDAVNARRLGRDRFTARPQQLAKRTVARKLSAGQADPGKLDHPRRARIEPGGLRVDDNGVERQKRGGATRPVHRPSPPAAT
jgi:hypothetical protein